MGIEQQINDALVSALSPTALAVINESHKHAGHSGDDGSGESHWRIEITAPTLDGKSRIAKHRGDPRRTRHRHHRAHSRVVASDFLDLAIQRGVGVGHRLMVLRPRGACSTETRTAH